jgi:hypothetical protein
MTQLILVFMLVSLVYIGFDLLFPLAPPEIAKKVALALRIILMLLLSFILYKVTNE